MDFQNIFPFWEQLSEKEQATVSASALSQKMKKGDILHRGYGECSGIIHVGKGQLRVYIVSEEGREVTLYRLHEGELCVLSASCLMDAIVFDVLIEAVQDSELVVLPSPALHEIMDTNPLVELSLYKRVVENFSDVMWTMQQILFMGADRRVAYFLWDEMAKTGEMTIRLTHEEVARFIGSAREVVTKVLKYFVEEGVVALSRGKIEIIDKAKLRTYL
ncbi:MAG: Crp/Fnr family transcriptional regulator [Anaerotignum sp.]|nr:Crp/Fnr family transcriptional regulator [Anaerotignum sp.]MBR2852418.1 Crp/Fnr family transcriptional regulator [Anaerotignum sp.]